MFSRIHGKLGTAGLIVAVVALVAALAGGAYAANGLNKQQKKQVRNIAKSESKKWSKKFSKRFAKAGPKGATGATGPAGPVGPAGANGANGAKGDTGAQGEPGEPGEPGPEGSPWTAGGTLPELETETGAWGGISEGEGFFVTPISFTLPLTEAPEVIYVGEAGTVAGCPGVEEGIPTASEGKLCVYESDELIGAPEYKGPLNPDGSAAVEAGSGKSGTILQFECAGTCFAYGTWAVTAPEAP